MRAKTGKAVIAIATPIKSEKDVNETAVRANTGKSHRESNCRE
jgi:hypothetical protein